MQQLASENVALRQGLLSVSSNLGEAGASVWGGVGWDFVVWMLGGGWVFEGVWRDLGFCGVGLGGLGWGLGVGGWGLGGLGGLRGN